MQTDLPTSATFKTARNMAMGSPSGVTEAATRDNFSKAQCTGRAPTFGRTVASTSALGTTTKCMETAFTRGQMARSIEGSSCRIRRKAGVCSLGPTDENMTVAGVTGSSTEKRSTQTRRGTRGKGTGAKANAKATG